MSIEIECDLDPNCSMEIRTRSRGGLPPSLIFDLEDSNDEDNVVVFIDDKQKALQIANAIAAWARGEEV